MSRHLIGKEAWAQGDGFDSFIVSVFGVYSILSKWLVDSYAGTYMNNCIVASYARARALNIYA